MSFKSYYPWDILFSGQPRVCINCIVPCHDLYQNKFNWMLKYMDLQLPMQSVPITTDVVGSTPAQGWSAALLCNKVCQWLAAGRWFSPGSPVSSINKTDRHDITEILLKVALNTI